MSSRLTRRLSRHPRSACEAGALEPPFGKRGVAYRLHGATMTCRSVWMPCEGGTSGTRLRKRAAHTGTTARSCRPGGGSGPSATGGAARPERPSLSSGLAVIEAPRLGAGAQLAGIRASWFTLILGTIALLSGLGSVYGINIPVGPLLIILVGLAIVVRAFQPRW